MTGKPCFHQKTFHVTEVKDYQATQEHHMCGGCSQTYIQLTNIGQEPMLFSPQQVQPVPVEETAPEQKPKTVKHTKGKKQPKYIETAEELMNLFMMKPPDKKKKPEILCPQCGLTPEEFQKIGKLGCPECYNYYKNDLPDLFKGCQEGATKHIGKVPKSYTPPVDVVALRIQMKRAIKAEKYEEAAALKKQIVEFEQKTEGTKQIDELESEGQ
jgi:protein-arginine kinase activator protein McsA